MFEKWKFCPYCGTKFIFCEDCEEITEFPNFCGECALHDFEIFEELNETD